MRMTGNSANRHVVDEVIMQRLPGMKALENLEFNHDNKK